MMRAFCHRLRFRTNFRAIALIWLCAGVAHAAPPPVDRALAAQSLGLARRTGQESCWAEFSIAGNALEQLCIPRRAWIQHFSAAGMWEGKWKAFSPPLLDQSRSKSIFYRWMATRSSTPDAPSILEGAKRSLEERREELSEWLQVSGADSLGIFRSLLLNQGSKASPLLAELGLLRLLTLSGIHLLALFWLIELASSCIFSFLRIGTRAALAITRALQATAFVWAWGLAGAPLRLMRPLLYFALRRGTARSGLKTRGGFVLALAFLADFGVAATLAWIQHQPLGDVIADPGRIFYFALLGSLLVQPKGGSSRLRWLRAGLAGWMASTLVSLAQRRSLSITGLILGELGIPLYGFVIYPALLLHSFSPFDPAPLLRMANDAILGLVRISLKWTLIWWVDCRALMAAAILGSILWLVPRKWRAHGGCAVAALAVGLRLLGSHPGSTGQVTQLDVGQGDAALIFDQGSTGLIDTGSGRLIREEQWLGLLDRLGIFRIDWVGLTHLDEDHASGILSLASLVPISCATTAEGELRSPRGLRWRAELEQRGVHVTSRLADCVPFPSLEPPLHRAGRRTANENMSAFLIPLAGGGFYLSAGDATAKDELRIGAWAITEARTLAGGPRILKISHHGSRTSTHPIFLRQIHPTEAWISDGIGNRYGHPSAEVLARLNQIKVSIRRTDQEGALVPRKDKLKANIP